MKKLWEEFQYFFQQKIYVIILCLTAICGYGFEMTHPSIGIDDTAVSLYLEDGLEVVMGRWFIYCVSVQPCFVFFSAEYSVARWD